MKALARAARIGWWTLVACAAILGAEPEEYRGLPVRGVFFSPADQPLTRDQLGLLVDLRPGDIYTPAAVGRAVERLFGSGRYSDIQVEAERKDGGVVLTFKTAPRYFVSRVELEGAQEPPALSQLLGAAGLELGTPFEAEDLPAAAQEITRTLRANGFYNAKVNYDTSRRDTTEEIDIRFVVTPGTRARFAPPVLRGNVELPQRQLLEETRWRRGLYFLGRNLFPRGWQEFTEVRQQKGIDRIRQYYRDRNYLLARIALDRLAYDREANTVTPNLAIDAGPRVFVKTAGAKVGKGTLRQLIPVFQERTVDRELLLEGRLNLIEHFRSRGYFEAQVEFDLARPDQRGEQTILYRIQRGPRSKLLRLDIAGNRYFDEATIRERLGMQPATFIRYRQGRFSQSLLEDDKEAIADLYRSNGFRDAKVESLVDRNTGKAGQIKVGLKIEEGPQWLISALELTGVDLRLYEQVMGLLSSTPGQPYSTTSLLNDRDTVLGFYYNNGYPEAQFDYSAEPDSQPYRMKLKITVREGRRNFVREVLVSGLKDTNPQLVQRRLTVTPAEPLSQADIVDSQRRLYDLGIFAKVDVAVQNPEGRERNKYVLFQLEEARRYSFNFGLGAEITRIGGGTASLNSPVGNPGFSPRVSLGVTRLNIFGTGHTAGVLTRFSRIQQRALLNYLAPQFLGDQRYNLTVSTLGDISRDVNTFTSRRLESAVQLGQRLSRSDTLQYRFVYRLVRVDEATLKIDPSLIPLLSQPVRVGVLSTTFLRDRRDDPLDSKKGNFTSLDFGGAAGAFGSGTKYARFVGRNSSYHRIGRDLVIARTVTGGWLNNLNAPGVPIPLPERFYGGGAVTHRGFPENNAGPRDPKTGFPVGGNAFLFLGTELRFPVLGRSLSGVLFHDAGNVYTSFDQISFRWRQRDLSDFNYMVQAFGLGVRYRTPIGPVRFDVGYSANSPRFVGFSGTLEDLIFNRPGLTDVQRVGRLQFHFSLGQTF